MVGTTLAALVAAGLAACGSSSVGPTPLALRPPLSVAAASSSGALGLVHVGAASGENSFWELMLRHPGSASWSLATPPGVQDNGGMVVATAARRLVVGFLPSENLLFSPLAISDDGGFSWTSEVLPSGLASRPDSLATASNGSLVALLARNDGEALFRPGSGRNWDVLATASGLARAAAGGSSCAPKAITAVAISAREGILLGATCRGRPSLAVYANESGLWRASTPPIPPPIGSSRPQLLRLTSTTAGSVALIGAEVSDQTLLFPAWRSGAGDGWRDGSVLRLPPGESLLATGTGPGEEAYVLTATGNARTIWVSDGSGRSWTRIAPSPPPNTATAVVDRGAAIDAFAVRGMTLIDWRLSPPSHRWRSAGTLKLRL